MNTTRASFDKEYHVVRVRVKTPKLKIPTRIGGWLHGFINGRTGSAAIDADGPLVRSGYISAYTEGYYTYTATLRVKLSALVTSCCSDLQELTLEFFSLSGSGKNPYDDQQSRSVEEIRSDERCLGRRIEIIHNMIYLYELLLENVNNYNRTAEAAAHMLSRSLAFYCKGVLFRKAVRPENIPTITIDNCKLHDDFPEFVPTLDAVNTILVMNRKLNKKEEKAS